MKFIYLHRGEETYTVIPVTPLLHNTANKRESVWASLMRRVPGVEERVKKKQLK